jgi:nucleoside-diphosphate-sugar epimerase
MVGRLVIVGRNSYIGNFFAGYAAARGADVIAVSSADCNFLEAGQVARFFAALGDEPCTIVALAVINKSVENTYRSHLQNLTIVRNLIDGHRLAHVESMVWFSSVDVYGVRPPLPITEETPVAPDTWYGLAKYSGEWMLGCSGEVACPVTILRIPGIYGPAPNDRSVIGRMVAGIRERRRVVIRGSGRSLRDYVHVGDVAALLEQLIPLRHHGVLNVATGESRTILEIADLLRDVLREEFEIVRGEADREREFDLVFDNRRLTALLPDFQFADIASGVASYRRGTPPPRPADPTPRGSS